MRIVIMLSTYNGSKYLTEQLDSILSQKARHLDILIRDDGSTDNTVTIIEDYCRKFSNISYYRGCNVGSCRSFFDLMTKVSDQYDYYALSDQDDCWMEDKVSNAIARLENLDKNIPALYCSDAIEADEKLNPIRKLFGNDHVSTDFRNSVFENIAVGCTCVFNYKLLQIVKDHIPNNCYMHDWWLYIVASYFGKVIYDKNAYILYRQHSNNVVGASGSIMKQYIDRILRSQKVCHIPSMQMNELLELYKIETEKDFIENVIRARRSLKARMLLVKRGSFKRTRRIDTVIYKMRLLICGC